jgi:hypothetical protein
MYWGFFSPNTNFLYAQGRPLRGVVWDVPASQDEALRDLVEMSKLKIEAVRTSIIKSDTLFALADSLKLQFFQELPIAYLPAQRLLDQQLNAHKLLIEAIENSKKYASARHFGLAQFCDTADPEASSYFLDLMRVIRERGAAGTKGYYTTHLLHTDEMAGIVDFVLVSALDIPDPLKQVQLWKEYHPSNKAGLTFGMGVQKDEVGGYLVPYSPEAQARYIESTLNQSMTNKSLLVVFVSKWKDGTAWEQDMSLKPLLHYGLKRADGKMRPAYEVMKGFYTDTQKVFAFKAGAQSITESLWAVVLAWIALVILMAAYIWSFRLQDMLPRYFFAHKSFQEYLGRTRDALMGTNGLLLTSFALCTGLAGAIICNLLLHSKGFAYFVNWLPLTFQQIITSSLPHAWGLTLFIGGFYAILIAISALLLFGIATILGQTVTPQKTLMLVIWTQWYKPVLLVLTLFFFLSDTPPSFTVSLWLCIFWGVLAIGAFIQRLVDYAFIIKTPIGLVLGVGFLFFLIIGIIGWFLWLPHIQPEWDFMQHLFTDETTV